MSPRSVGPIPPRSNCAESLRSALTEALSLEHDAPALPGRLREIIRPLLPERAFLRRARGEGTFITDSPRHSGDNPVPLLTACGFLCAEQKGCLILSPGASMLTDFELRHPDPPDFFCETLLRFRSEPPCGEAIALFATGVRLLEASTDDERRLYRRRARNLAALCLRNHTGGAYACALIAHILEP